MPSINRASSLPAAQQVAAHYRDLIRAGDLPPDARLPSNVEIARDWDVSPVTVRAALDILRAEGLIRPIQGRGTFVRPPMKRWRRDTASYQAAKDCVLLPEDERRKNGASENDLGTPIEKLDFKATYRQIVPSPEISHILDIEADALVLERRYVSRFRDSGLLAQESVEHIPLALLQPNDRLLNEDEEPWPGGGMHQFYTVGIEIDRMDDIVTASMPDPEEQLNWGLEPGVPMLRTQCTSYDVTGRPVSVSCASYPADRTELAFSTRLLRWSHKSGKGQPA